jgi:hypothetical protein
VIWLDVLLAALPRVLKVHYGGEDVLVAEFVGVVPGFVVELLVLLEVVGVVRQLEESDEREPRRPRGNTKLGRPHPRPTEFLLLPDFV